MTDNTDNHEPQKLYTIAEVAELLKISVRTLRRYVDAGMFEFLVIVPRVERRRILFTQHSIDAFLKKFSSSGLRVDPQATEERPKRTYNRAVKKYARKKKPARRNKAA